MSNNQPTEELAVISTTELRDAIPITGTKDDANIRRLCYVASANLEAICGGTAFLKRTFTEDYSGGENGYLGGAKKIYTLRGPIVSVTSITDDDGNTVSSADYRVVNRGYSVSYLEHGTVWPAPSASTAGATGRWTIVYIAGIWDDTDDVAYEVKQAAFQEAQIIRAQTGEATQTVSMSGRSGSKSVSKGSPGAVNPTANRLLWRYKRRFV